MIVRHIFKLNEHGDEFLTRRQGERIRAMLATCYEGIAIGDFLVIEFEGVEAMAPSFADECLGKFAERVGVQKFRGTIRLTGASDTIRTLINAVLSERLNPDDPA